VYYKLASIILDHVSGSLLFGCCLVNKVNKMKPKLGLQKNWQLLRRMLQLMRNY